MDWYLLKTNPKREQVAAASLRAKHIQVVAPFIRTQQITRYRSNTVITPLFPSYIFALLGEEHFPMLRTLHGVHSIIDFGGIPAIVPAEVISDVKSRIGEDGFVELDEPKTDNPLGLKPDDRVEIIQGSFSGFTGVFVCGMKSGERVRILFESISERGGQVSFQVEFPREFIMPLRAAA